MKLLILTQKVNKNDPVLGFFHEWIEKFASRFEKVFVVCLEKGDYDLPQNVEVFSLGKEEGKNLESRVWGFRKIKYIWNFYRYIFFLRKEYDTVFVHMNPEYVVLGGFFWRICSKKIALWYTHRQSNLKLWLAEKLTNMVFTSAPQSFTLKSDKVSFLGHGISTEFFKSINKKYNNNTKIFIHVGRITKIKNCDILIETAKILKEKWSTDFKLKFLGDTVLDKDVSYKKSLLDLVEKYDLGENIEFVGFVTPYEIVKFYAEADASFNLAPTGGVDKSVLESIVALVPTFVSNQSFAEIFGSYKDMFMFREFDYENLAKKVIDYFSLNNIQKEIAVKNLSQKVSKIFDTSVLVDKIYSKLNESTSK